ncbi:MAG TPA: hypothetical protein VFN30_13110 [Chitinophagaceae bacterium]|nr:hypothetical protein [Chitinophagaceae bacterium]
MSIRYFYIPIFLFFSCLGRKEGENRIFKKSYYNNGNLKSEGFFNKQGLPIDTLKTYDSIGTHLKRLEVYDTAGNLNGVSLLFYPNGNVEQKRYFLKNRFSDTILNYYENGTLKSIGFTKDDHLYGDKLYFYQNGKIKGYNFFDFFEHNLLYHFYDSLSGKRIEALGDQIMVDSTEYIRDSITLDFFVAHPPFTSNRLLIEKLDNNNKIIDSFALPDTAKINHFKFYKSLNLKSILLRIIQYDSILKKEKEINYMQTFADTTIPISSYLVK